MVSQWSYVFTSQFYTNYFSLENRLKINGSIRGTYFFLQYSFGNYLYSLFVMIKWLFEISKMCVGFCLSSPNLMYVPRELLLMEFHSSLLILHVASMCCFLWACLLSQKHFFFWLIMKTEIKISLLKYSGLDQYAIKMFQRDVRS